MTRSTIRLLRSWLLRLASLAGVGRGDAEIVEELEAHRRFLADEYVHGGMRPDEARRRAAAELGSVSSTAAAYRDQRGVPALEDAMRDARMAFRSFVRTPMLSLSIILVLGLGIGLSTAIAAIFHAVVWMELPVAAPQDVMRISQRFDGVVDRRVQGQVSRFSYPELEMYRQSTRAFAAVTGVNHANVTWHDDAETRPLRAALVSGDYFRVLPVSPARGRVLTLADAREPVAVVAHRLWTQRLAAADDVVGRRLRLNGAVYTIVGIAPPAFSGTEVEAVDVWLPLETASVADGKEGVGERNLSWLQILGRLAPYTSVATARAEATLIASQLEQEYPGRRTSIELMRASRLDRGGVRQSRVVTMSAVAVSISGLLFLICGSNAAALLLARGASRQKENAVRVALGSSRRHIVRQLAAEVGMVAAASAAVGVLVCVATRTCCWASGPTCACSASHSRRRSSSPRCSVSVRLVRHSRWTASAV